MPEMTAAEAIGYARDWIVEYGTEHSHVAQVFVALLDHSKDLAARLDRAEAFRLEVARQAYLKEATA